MKKKPAVPDWVIFLGILFFFLCIYVFLHSKVIAIGYKMQEAKKKYEDLDMLNKNYRAEILKLTSQAELLKKAENLQIEFVSPSKWCYFDIEKENPIGAKNGKAEAGTH